MVCTHSNILKNYGLLFISYEKYTLNVYQISNNTTLELSSSKFVCFLGESRWMNLSEVQNTWLYAKIVLNNV